ncbi:NmrA family NAD(P)-binding protein [Pontibacter sp. E15-1]|uniref:SDR family oxidoreductase n=1 Tax=Pontibacter sp. E15-1 TaxID=2919918 RepID=UPI001F5037BB|nr:NmrA family NAD(P)-binding protein [Pontibacter sp. E15-1]MCJ8164172.1 NmrA family NAD(P)-binding protein [Pontibacter sp. E15-1]
MKVLVIGGTGTVGSHVVKELLARNADVTVLTRSEEHAHELPQGTHSAVGDLLDPTTVRSVFKGMEGVFMLNPVSTTETSLGLFALNGAQMAGVRHMVYMSVHQVDQAVHLPHFGSKIPVEMALKASGMDYTILRPNNFFQNDNWFTEALQQHGVYPQPIGSKGLSRVDTRDIAEAAAIALTEQGHSGKTYNLVGPEPLTGPQTAEIWQKVLGKPIVYGGDDLDAWEQQTLQYMEPWKVFDFKLMYEFFQKNGFKGTAEDVDHLTKLLGHAPRTFEKFVQETAEQWKSAA